MTSEDQHDNTISLNRVESTSLGNIFPHVLRVFQSNALLPPDSSEEWCANLDVVGESNRWIQITSNILNFPYHASSPPDYLLQTVLKYLPAAKILTWQPTIFVTVSFESQNPLEIAKIVDEIFVQFFRLDHYAVTATILKIPLILKFSPICNIVMNENRDLNS